MVEHVEGIEHLFQVTLAENNHHEVDTPHKVTLAYHKLGWEHSADTERSAYACQAEVCYLEEMCS